MLHPHHRGSEKKVCFMTTKVREMFPLKMASDRFGNALCPLKGAPQLGPGCYDVDEKTSLFHGVRTKLVSTKGYTLGARTGPRLAVQNINLTPAPGEHFVPSSYATKDSKKPFEVGSERFPVRKRDLLEVTPGAGTYDTDVAINRKVHWHQSFGGAPILLPSVSLRSTIDRNTDKLYSTKEERKYHRKLAYLKLYY
ncbi:unnamed protein product [Lymnaea stagnalis]|uniref:Protein pitchfork n=1 Tax=Lymnaea stagnalis TaxID=6523 RepID=A0AAV2IQP7_LYMST